jgi:hypothetical protein
VYFQLETSKKNRLSRNKKKGMSLSQSEYREYVMARLGNALRMALATATRPTWDDESYSGDFSHPESVLPLGLPPYNFLHIVKRDGTAP